MTDPARTLTFEPPLASSVSESLESSRGELPRRHLETTLGAPLTAFLARRGKELRGLVAELSWAASGGRGEPPQNLSLAVEALHAGSLIVDDVEDESPRRRGGPALHVVCGVPLAINAGTWMYFHGAELACAAARDAESGFAIAKRVHSTLLRCHEGQALDLGVRITSVERTELPTLVREITERKTSALFSLAAWLGAAVVTLDEEKREGLASYASDLGTSLQMMDDLSGLVVPSRAAKGEEDLRHGRVTWPWAWAWESLSSSPERFERLRERASSPSVLEAGDAALLDDLGRAAEALGRHEIRRTLERAMSTLRSRLPSTPARKELIQLAERMETAFAR